MSVLQRTARARALGDDDNRSRNHWLNTVLLVVSGLLVPRYSYADVTATLAWVRARGAEQCPNAAVVQTNIEQHLGYRAFVQNGTYSVEVSVAREGQPEHWNALIFVRDFTGRLIGERQIEVSEPGCDSLVSAVSLAVAITLDAGAALRTSQNSSTPTTPEWVLDATSHEGFHRIVTFDYPRQLLCESCLNRRRPRRPRNTPRWEGNVTLGTGFSIGHFPSVAWQLGVQAELLPPHWPGLQLGFWFWPEQTNPISTISMAQYRLLLAGAEASVCPRLVNLQYLSFSLCGGAFVGAMTATGANLDRSVSLTRPFVSLDAGAMLRVRYGYFTGETGVTAMVPLTITQITVEGFGQLHTASVIAMRAHIGIGVHF